MDSAPFNRREFLAGSAGALIALPGLARGADAQVLTRVDTALGAFTIAVDPYVAPATVANYLAYVDGGYLDGGAVYRLVTMANQPPETPYKIEVVQWGMNLPDGKAPPFAPIPHETTRDTGLKHLDGTVSMARSTPGSAASEFFICIGDQPELDFGGRRNPDGQGFAAFGRVVKGREVVFQLHRRAQAQQMLAQPIPVRQVRRVLA
ncbi:peptidylprolyl isomerase [Caenimonas aquaedulcis]|uniref:peptidylprolyl isomerase n=1 Tax=Caenimonas aquaedulcis TaxID=2793270 RepID=A0A931H7J1_9BURK|nr:peptidylprolyl isomerase [Caenimonas aquaedulcis]MBG9389892.1 peptidylprolyl isomerase [Caenimonas aquaedulcis]